MYCCCRDEKCRRTWCEQTNTADPQATILNREAGFNSVQVVNLDVRQSETTQSHPMILVESFQEIMPGEVPVGEHLKV